MDNLIIGENMVMEPKKMKVVAPLERGKKPQCHQWH